MAAFTTTLSTTASLDDSIKLAYDQSFLIATGMSDVMDQLAQYRQSIGAKSITLTKYPRLAVATTPLTETDDLTSAQMTDSAIVVTPLEYGNVVTTTALADLQSGGQAGRAAVEIVGLNAAETSNALATLALDAGTKVTINDTALASIINTEICTGAFLNRMYNKLSRVNTIKFANGLYAAVLHDDVITDLRASAAAGDWVDVTKYSDPASALMNEIGTYRGFRIITNNAATINADAGAGAVDVYNSYFLGQNALGLAESLPSQLVMTGPYDKLGRFINVGWKRVAAYKIIDSDALVVGQTASSVGANA